MDDMWTEPIPFKSREEEMSEALEAIPFPEHLFSAMTPKAVELFRRNWSGNADKLLKNLDSEMGLRTEMIYEEDGVTPKEMVIYKTRN